MRSSIIFKIVKQSQDQTVWEQLFKSKLCLNMTNDKRKENLLSASSVPILKRISSSYAPNIKGNF